MFDKLIKLSLENRLIVLVAALLLLITGVLVAIRLPVDVFPDLTAPTVTVITEAHGMAAEEIETLVTFPIETAVNGATGVRRKIVVQANVSGRDLRSVIDDIRARLDKNVSMPQGYYVEFGGQFESEQAATRLLTLLSLVSIAAIFLILYLEFGAFRPALFIMVNLPLALIGGIWAVFFTSGIISVASLVGFITLFGIATRNGILMIEHYHHLLAEGKSFRDAIVQGSLERLNPILMTALAAGLGLIPLALGGGEPGKEIQTPMALVILGGLLSSTALNMIVVPSLFYKFGEEKPHNKNAIHKQAPPELTL